jgi:hypothetical protein
MASISALALGPMWRFVKVSCGANKSALLEKGEAREVLWSEEARREVVARRTVRVKLLESIL